MIRISGYAQGTTYSVTYYATDSIVHQSQTDSLLNSIDSSFSLYKPYSLINRFNESEKGITVNNHFIKVFKKSAEAYKKTAGLFDITIYPLVQAWGFGVKKTNTPPGHEEIEELKKCCGSHLLDLKGNHLLKKKSCVQIDMNGIAQGYSVDMLAALLERYGIKNYIVELGGEIRVKGRKQPSGEKFTIGIESPAGDDFGNHSMQKIIRVNEGAITTSGSYRNYYESNKKKNSHLIDPRSGYPVQNELISVSVFAKDAVTADAYDNALMLMGLKQALSFLKKRNDIAAYFIYTKKNGETADTASSGFYTLMNH